MHRPRCSSSTSRRPASTSSCASSCGSTSSASTPRDDVLLTTHYLEEAEQLCDRIAFIDGGRIVAQGTSVELSATYGVASLEDAYLELVGRGELSRARLEDVA
jgi:hypothetical protein